MLNETRRSRCSCALKVVDTFTTTPDDDVKIIIITNIDKYGRAMRTCIDVAERTVIAGAKYESRISRCADVLIVTDITVINSDCKVRVTVTIQVSQCECTPWTHGNVIKWIGRTGALRENRGGHRTGILEVCDGAITISDDKVGGAVTVKVGVL